ncbi:MAG: hypothetical protein HYS06_12405 [Methylocystis sp.]|nr:hypothetical protein [Methylocystis sp.]
MHNLVKLSLGLACLGAVMGTSDALARPRRHGHAYGYASEAYYYGRPPLVVQRRSFLDPGTKVPVGSRNRYVVEQTFFNQDPIQANQRSWFGGETLPRRLDQPWSDGQFQF